MNVSLIELSWALMLARPHRASAILLLTSLLGTRSALADAEACARSYEDAQSLRRDGKLLDARAALVACARDACPSVLRKDCASWLTELGEETPTIAVRVHGPDGCDRAEAAVSVDGTDVPGAADGRALALDPGRHALRAAVDGSTIDRVIVLARGERNRMVTLDLAPQGVVCGASPSTARSRPSPLTDLPRSPAPRAAPPLTYLLGGLGLAGISVGGAFAVVAWNQKSTLDDCKGHCAQGDVDTMQRSFVVADIATVVGVVSLGIAAALYFKR